MKFIPYVQTILVFIILGLAGSAENNSIPMAGFLLGALACGFVIYGLQCFLNASEAKHTRRRTARPVRRVKTTNATNAAYRQSKHAA